MQYVCSIKLTLQESPARINDYFHRVDQGPKLKIKHGTNQNLMEELHSEGFALLDERYSE